MPKHYVYRMDHDLGFAPHVAGKICTLCGCKTKTIEKWAKPGSWVVGIGGIGTGKPDALIYAMKVSKNLSLSKFAKTNVSEVEYLFNKCICNESNILVSDNFYYFGQNALILPTKLRSIIFDRHGCKCLTNQEIENLEFFINQTHPLPGKYGDPNGTQLA